MERESAALISLNPVEARTEAAAFERLFPADENGPGAIEIGVLTYVDRALSGAYRNRAEAYRLGLAYKDHIKEWQHFCTVRIQPDTLSYESNFLDLDPRHRDRSGLGLPLVRITYDLRENEGRLAAWMEDRSEEILRRMGATRTWRGPRFTGVGSSHDLGGCRMGEDPASSVVSPELRVHDTPGLYVFGGAVFPTCPGINPTHTLWALCCRAAGSLAERLRKGEER